MKAHPFPARLTGEQQAGLQRIAEACSVKKADALGWAADALIKYFDQHGGRVLLPLDFSNTFIVLPTGEKRKRFTLTEKQLRDLQQRKATHAAR